MIRDRFSFAGLGNGVVDSARYEQILLAATAQALPNIEMGRLADGFRGSVRGRKVAGHSIARVRTSDVTLDASATRGKAAGLEGWCKLVWQIAGSARFEDADGAFRLKPGALAILPMSADYQCQLEEGCDGLMMVFNPAVRKEWARIALDHMWRPIEPSGAIAAAGAGVASMLRHATGDSTDNLACDAVLDLVLRAITHNQTSSTARLRRAAVLVEQRLADSGYGPVALARDLGISRRSLYEIFARAGSTPANFIRQIRLDHAKRDILYAQERSVSLTQIAFDNGFADGSSFSRAFKDAFGLSPRAWRDNGSSRKPPR
jgi:AraC family transcriptional regulator, positive regulator of tynA and feaB